jgi:hypothetical protein
MKNDHSKVILDIKAIPNSGIHKSLKRIDSVSTLRNSKGEGEVKDFHTIIRLEIHKRES